MPVCSRCGRLDATVEMRRGPKKAESGMTIWFCKDKEPCAARRKQLRRAQKTSQP